MPTEHVRLSYKYEELTETAKKKAVESVREKMTGDWWDSFDIEDISDSIRYSLAGSFKTPGWDTFGEGDFPGIDGVSVEGWNLSGGDYLSVKGSLDRGNAPGLAWPDQVASVDLSETRYGTNTIVNAVELLTFTCAQCGRQAGVYSDWSDQTVHLTADGQPDDEQDTNHIPVQPRDNPVRSPHPLMDAFEQVIRDCLSEALQTGREQMEYKESEEYALEAIEANDFDFTEEGDLF